jgi:hypothetical protein
MPPDMAPSAGGPGHGLSHRDSGQRCGVSWPRKNTEDHGSAGYGTEGWNPDLIRLDAAARLPPWPGSRHPGRDDGGVGAAWCPHQTGRHDILMIP